MPILDSDLQTETLHIKQRQPARLPLALGFGIVAIGVSVGVMFLVSPKQTKQTVNQVVQAAQELVAKVSPAKPVEEDAEDEETPAVSTTRRTRRGSSAAPRPRTSRSAAHNPASDSAAAPPAAAPAKLPNWNLPVGTARGKVREMVGEPDLDLYKLEKNHELEYLVYVNRTDKQATSVLLVDGLVASVYSDTPSVWSWR